MLHILRIKIDCSLNALVNYGRIVTVNYCTVKHGYLVVWEELFVHALCEAYYNINQIYLKAVIRFCVLCAEW